MIVSCISYPPIWRYFIPFLSYIYPRLRSSDVSVYLWVLYILFFLGDLGWHLCIFSFCSVISQLILIPCSLSILHTAGTWSSLICDLFPSGRTGNIVVEHIMKTILDRLIRNTPTYTTKPRVGLIKRNRWRGMRLTTNVPKSGGRVIICTGVETERIDVALGLIRRHVS